MIPLPRKFVIRTKNSEEIPITELTPMKGDLPAGDRIRLSCDISREYHRKLKIEAATSGRTLVEVVESLIADQLTPQPLRRENHE